jgi:hypothetical protein
LSFDAGPADLRRRIAVSLPASLRVGAALLAVLGGLAWWAGKPPPAEPAADAPRVRPAAQRIAVSPSVPLAPRAHVVLEPPVAAFDPMGTYPTRPLAEKVGTVEGASDDEATETMRAPPVAPLPPPPLEDKSFFTAAPAEVSEAPPAPAPAYKGEGANDDEAAQTRPE